MIGLICFIATTVVGGLGIGAMVVGVRKDFAKRRLAERRARAAHDAHALAEVQRVKLAAAKLAAAKAPLAPAHAFAPGELTGVIDLLDQSAPFARAAAQAAANPPPVPRRMAKGSVPHPIQSQQPPPAIRRAPPPPPLPRTIKR
jgi:hypothetical protein